MKKEKSANISTLENNTNPHFLPHCIFWAVVLHVIIIIKLYDFTWIKLVSMKFQDKLLIPYMSYTLKLAIHLAWFAWCYFCRLFAENKTSVNQWELMPIHVVHITLFSYFHVACENSVLIAIVFFHIIPLTFSHEDHSMCECYAICELRHMKNLQKEVYILLFYVIALCDTW